MDDQVTQQTGNQDQSAQANQSLGWRAALPDEFKEHEFVKTFQKPGDFVKSALEIKTEYDSLKTKMGNAIVKPGDKATEEEKQAFYKALGRPDKPEEYEFPKGAEVEHDPKMVEWAQKTFHSANLSKDQAKIMSQAWDGFIHGMARAQAEAAQKEIENGLSSLKTEYGAEFDKNMAIKDRALKAFLDPEFAAFLEKATIDGVKAGNHPALIKAFVEIGKKMLDDSSEPGSQPAGGKTIVGMNYTTMPDFSKGG